MWAFSFLEEQESKKEAELAQWHHSSQPLFYLFNFFLFGSSFIPFLAVSFLVVLFVYIDVCVYLCVCMCTTLFNLNKIKRNIVISVYLIIA